MRLSVCKMEHKPTGAVLLILICLGLSHFCEQSYSRIKILIFCSFSTNDVPTAILRVAGMMHRLPVDVGIVGKSSTAVLHPFR